MRQQGNRVPQAGLSIPQSDSDCTAAEFEKQVTPYFNAISAVFAWP